MTIETTPEYEAEHFGSCVCASCSADRDAIAQRIAEVIRAANVATKCGCRSIFEHRERNAAMKCMAMHRDEIEDRCAYISRELLDFDPRENEAPTLRTVDSRKLLNALVLAYHAGKTGR